MRADNPAPDKDNVSRTDLSRYLEQLALAPSETAYDELAAYAFARRYVAGKVVADIGWEVVGLGSQLLAETAESVAGLTSSAEAAQLARTAHPTPNAEYRKVDLPELPYPEGQFDVVVAFGVLENLERPEDLVREAKRVLKPDGALLISAPDRLLFVDGRNPDGNGYRRGMYAAEFRELLESFFGRVLMCRQGAVGGSFVFPISGELDEASVESASLSSTNPRLGTEPPPARSLVAVCGDAETLELGEPYLLLDRDRRVFDECEDRAEDVELLRGEVLQLQHTEVQAFLDALKVRGKEIGYLRARIRRAEAHARHMREVAQAIENSTIWRLFEPYRQLRTRIDAVRGRGASGESSGGGSDRPDR